MSNQAKKPRFCYRNPYHLEQDEQGWFIPRPETFSRLVYEVLKRGMTVKEIAQGTGRSYNMVAVLAYQIRGGRAKMRKKVRSVVFPKNNGGVNGERASARM